MATPSFSTSISLDAATDALILDKQSAAPASDAEAIGTVRVAAWKTAGSGGLLAPTPSSNESAAVDALSEKLDFAVSAYVTPFIVALGLAANVLCCLALRAARFQPAVSALLLGLVAAGDSLALVLNFFEFTVPVLMIQRPFASFYFSSGLKDVYEPAVGSFITPSSRLLHRYETLLLLLLILDRYVAVYKPCGARKLLRSTKQTLVWIGAAFVLVVLFSLPDFLVYRLPTGAKRQDAAAATAAATISPFGANSTRPFDPFWGTALREGRSNRPPTGYAVSWWSTSPLYFIYQVLLILIMTIAPFICLNFMVIRIAWTIRSTVLRRYSVRFQTDAASVEGAQSRTNATAATTLPIPSPVDGPAGRLPLRVGSHQSLAAAGAASPEPKQGGRQKQSSPTPQAAHHNLQKRDEYRSVLVTLLAFTTLSIVCDVPAIVVASIQAALSFLRIADFAIGSDAALSGGFARQRMKQLMWTAQSTSEHLSLVDGCSNFLMLICLHKRYREAFVCVSGVRRALDYLATWRARRRERAVRRRIEREREREMERLRCGQVGCFEIASIQVGSAQSPAAAGQPFCGCGYRVALSPSECIEFHEHQPAPANDPLLEQWPFTEFLAHTHKTRATPAVWRRIIFARRAR